MANLKHLRFVFSWGKSWEQLFFHAAEFTSDVDFRLRQQGFWFKKFNQVGSWGVARKLLGFYWVKIEPDKITCHSSRYKQCTSSETNLDERWGSLFVGFCFVTFCLYSDTNLDSQQCTTTMLWPKIYPISMINSGESMISAHFLSDLSLVFQRTDYD